MSIPLSHDFKKFMEIVDLNLYNEIMDLRNYSFLAPPTLLPLLSYMDKNSITDYYPNNNTRDYLERVLGRKRCTDTTLPLRQLKTFKNYNNIHYDVPDEINNYLNSLTDEIKMLLPSDLDWQSLFLLLYESLINIYKHSGFDKGYILCQKYPNRNITDICLIDDGISIPGSFEKFGFDFIDDSEVIYEAINGKSTDKEKEGIHGRGLNTSARLTSLGFDEEMLIASREGLCIINQNGAKIKEIDSYYVEGTFITIRVNNKKIGQKLFDYLPLRTIHKIK